MPQAALKPCEPADPLDAAQAEQEAARAEAASITAQLAELTRGGPGYDQLEHQRLKTAQEAALKTLRAADLQLEEQKAAATAPISARVLGKIRAMRRKVADLHPSLISRMAELNRLRAHLQDLRNSIEQMKDSAEYRHDQRELLRVFGGKVDGQVDTSRSGKALARLERDLSNTTTEAALAVAAQAEASETWRNAKTTLEAWEVAIRAQGPGAARALLELPRAGMHDSQGLNPGAADIEIGRGSFSTKAMTP